VSSPDGRAAGLRLDSIIMTDNLARVLDAEIDVPLGRFPRMSAVDTAIRHTLWAPLDEAVPGITVITMKSDTLKVVRIGNSRGVRLPVPLLARYRIKTKVVAEQRPDGILLKPAKDDRLSWADTARAMQSALAKHGDDFADLDATTGDGLDTLDR